MTTNLKVKFSDIERIELIGGRKAKTLVNAVSEFDDKPDYVFNATHFDNSFKSPTYGVTISDTVVDGKFINGGNYSSKIYTDDGIGFDKDGKMQFLDLKTEYKNGKAIHDSYVGGSPTIIKNGKLHDDFLNTVFAKQKTQRIGMGFDNDEVIVYFSDDKITLKQLAQEMLKLGCKYAVALDGGGSLNVQKFDGTKYVHLDKWKFNRPVSTFVCIWLKKKKEETPKKDTAPAIPNGALGVMEVQWKTLNRRAGSSAGTALINPPLKKGDRITVFEQKGSWVRSYGYWCSINGLKWIKRY